MGWEVAFFFLLGAALVAFWLARRRQIATGLPAGRMVYADTTRWRPTERPLFSRSHRLTGRPDYLVRRGTDVIPVEVKSGHAPSDQPYTSHLLQLAAYCLLVEETFGRRPPYGIILYTEDADWAHEIDYTPALEAELLSTLDGMRCALVEGYAVRDHGSAARCRACSYRGGCSQSLA